MTSTTANAKALGDVAKTAAKKAEMLSRLLLRERSQNAQLKRKLIESDRQLRIARDQLRQLNEVVKYLKSQQDLFE